MAPGRDDPIMRLSSQEFDRLVEQAISGLPGEFRRHLENVIVEVQRRPSRRLLEEQEVPPGETLLGFYDGVPLTEKSVEDIVEMPERILIFKEPIESCCDTREEVVREIRMTVLHEIGHHFGMDEDELDRLGYG